jgi:hypothetical protein
MFTINGKSAAQLLSSQSIRAPYRRWDMWGVGLAALLLQIVSQTSSAFFLHFDTSTQDVEALEWARGCWGESTLKILPAVLLGPIYKIFGPAHQWESILLLFWAAVTVALVYELTRLLSGRRIVGLLAALLLMALPTFQYFSRTHLGYPMPFLLLGWLAAWHKRWNWTGLFFGLAVTAHYNSWVPVGLALAGLAILYLRLDTWKQWVGLLVCFAGPLLFMDALFFFYTGVPFEWDRDVFKEVLRLSVLSAATPHPNWLWVWQTVVSSNGLLLTLGLGFALFAPLVVWKDKTGMAMLASFLGLAAVYTVQGGLGRAFLVSRILATSYPFWVIGAAVVLGFLISRITAVRWQWSVTALIGLGLMGLIGQTAIFIHTFTETPFPTIEAAIARAAQEGRPVRYIGNFWIPTYFAQIDGIEMLGNDSRWIDAKAPGQDVLFFEGSAPSSLSQENYDIQVTQVNASADQVYPGLTEEATIPRRVEVWWPTSPSQPIGRPTEMLPYTVYFDGSGCVTPPTYGNGQLFFYQLVWQKFLQKLGLG